MGRRLTSAATDWSDGAVSLRPGWTTAADHAAAQSVCDCNWYNMVQGKNCHAASCVNASGAQLFRGRLA